MNEIQKVIVERIKDDWARCGCVYKDIKERDDIVYMILYNGTALTISRIGKTSWERV